MSAGSILLVEDSPLVAQFLVRILGYHGFEVMHARDGNDAWIRLQVSSKPDLLMTDIQMPYLDGCALIARVRGDVSLRNLPILVVTALDRYDVRVKQLQDVPGCRLLDKVRTAERGVLQAVVHELIGPGPERERPGI